MTYRLIKTETENRVTYESNTITIILWKNKDHLRIEISTPWPVGQCQSWKDYCEMIETDGTIIIPTED